MLGTTEVTNFNNYYSSDDLACEWVSYPLVTDSLYLVCMTKISILKKEGIIEKISYERRAYEVMSK